MAKKILLKSYLNNQARKHHFPDKTVKVVGESVLNDLYSLLVPFKVEDTIEGYVIHYDNPKQMYLHERCFLNQLGLSFNALKKNVSNNGGILKEYRVKPFQIRYYVLFENNMKIGNFLSYYEKNVAKKARELIIRHCGL